MDPIRAAMLTAQRLARGGYADGGVPAINDPNSEENRKRALMMFDHNGLSGTGSQPPTTADMSAAINAGVARGDNSLFGDASPNLNTGILGGIGNTVSNAANGLLSGASTIGHSIFDAFSPYSNANYQPGAVQTFDLAPPNTAQTTTTTNTPTATANVATANPNQMFTDSGKISSRAGEELPGYMGPERSAFVDQSKGMMGAYGQLPSSFPATNFVDELVAQYATPEENFNGAVAGQNLAGTFDPLASNDVLGDTSHGTFGLSGPTGLSNAMQQTDEQVSEQEAQQEAEQAAAEQAASEQAAAAEADAGASNDSAPSGGGSEESRGGSIHSHMPFLAHGGLIEHALRLARGGYADGGDPPDEDVPHGESLLMREAVTPRNMAAPSNSAPKLLGAP
jgi:hypothetical protein